MGENRIGMPQSIVSPPIAPGGTWTAAVFFKRGQHLDFDVSVETAAQFTFERLEEMSPGEVLASTGGRVALPALYVRMRNHSDRVGTVRATARTSVSTEALQVAVEHELEAAWSRGGDAITPADVEALLRAAGASYAGPSPARPHTPS